MTGGGVEYVSYEDKGNLYKITVAFEGRDISMFITKDAKYFVQRAIPIEVPKSDKPKVELFIWSYCPSGVQAQGILADVVSLLEKNVDFEAALYYGGHGEYEIQQNKIQACIQEIAKDKYWEYASDFVKNIYPKCGSSRDIKCDKTESIKLMKSLGIDYSKVMSCVKDRGEDLLSEYSSRAKEYGVTGSPTLIINGVKANTARTAEAFKNAVCEAFNTPPSECSTSLNSSAASSSGNC
mgnify:CR=1 FL=1